MRPAVGAWLDLEAVKARHLAGETWLGLQPARQMGSVEEAQAHSLSAANRNSPVEPWAGPLLEEKRARLGGGDPAGLAAGNGEGLSKGGVTGLTAGRAEGLSSGDVAGSGTGKGEEPRKGNFVGPYSREAGGPSSGDLAGLGAG